MEVFGEDGDAHGRNISPVAQQTNMIRGDPPAMASHQSKVQNFLGQSVSSLHALSVDRSLVAEGLSGLGLPGSDGRVEFGGITFQADEMASVGSQQPAICRDFPCAGSQQEEGGYGVMMNRRGLVEDDDDRVKGARVYRKGFWSSNETMVLLALKRQDNEKQARGSERERNRISAERWREIEEGFWARGVRKSSQQIKDKWDHLSADFKKVRDYENSGPVGKKSYWQMTTDERRDIKNMPLHFHLQVFQYMSQWMRKSKPIRRPVVVDSLQQPISGTDCISMKKRRLFHRDGIDLKDSAAHALEKMGQNIEQVLRENCKLQMDSQKQISQAHIEAQKQITQSQIDAQKQMAQMQIDMQKQLIEVQVQQGKEFIAAMYAMANVLGELGSALKS